MDFLSQIAQLDEEVFSPFVERFKKFKALKKPRVNSKDVLIRDVEKILGPLTEAFQGVVDTIDVDAILSARAAAGHSVSESATEVAPTETEESDLDGSMIQEQHQETCEPPQAPETETSAAVSGEEQQQTEQPYYQQEQPEESMNMNAENSEESQVSADQYKTTEHQQQNETETAESFEPKQEGEGMETTTAPFTSADQEQQQQEQQQQGEEQSSPREEEGGESSPARASLAGAPLLQPSLAGAPILNPHRSMPGTRNFPPASGPGIPFKADKYSVFVGGLPPVCSEEEIRAFIRESIGETYRSIDIKKAAPPSNENRGFCFVEFDNFPDADRARRILNGGNFQGRILTGSWANKRDFHTRAEQDMPPPGTNKTLYVINIPKSSDESAVRETFSRFGTFNSVILIRTPPPAHESRGFGFVEFTEVSAAEAAMAAIKEKQVEMEGQLLQADWARPPPPREDRSGPRGGDRDYPRDDRRGGPRGGERGYGGPGPMYEYGRDRYGGPPPSGGPRFNPYDRQPYGSPQGPQGGRPQPYGAPSPYAPQAATSPYAPRDPYSAPSPYGGAPNPYSQPPSASPYGAQQPSAPGGYGSAPYSQYSGYQQQPAAGARPVQTPSAPSSATTTPSAYGGYGASTPQGYGQYSQYQGYNYGQTQSGASAPTSTPASTTAAAPSQQTASSPYGAAPASTGYGASAQTNVATSAASSAMTPAQQQQQQQYNAYYAQYYAQYQRQAAGATPGATGTTAPSTGASAAPQTATAANPYAGYTQQQQPTSTGATATNPYAGYTQQQAQQYYAAYAKK